VAQVGHSGIERLLFGSTAARVVKHAPCDVLVVRGEGKKKH
jgi:universal stress protein A